MNPEGIDCTVTTEPSTSLHLQLMGKAKQIQQELIEELG